MAPPGVRVIAGSARGRRLFVPKGDAVRPTKDRVKAAIFSALDSRGLLHGASVLDLYAGSGSLGIEAVSRGAASATFVESAPPAIDAVRHNVELCGFGPASTIVARNATTFVAAARSTFDVAFVDPPYETADDVLAPLIETLAATIVPGGLIVLERPVRSNPPVPSEWRESWHRRFGDTLVVFLTPMS